MPTSPKKPNVANKQLKSGVVLVNKVPAGAPTPKPSAPKKSKKS